MYNMCVILLVIVNSVIHAAHAEDVDIVFKANVDKYNFFKCAPAYRPVVLESDDPTSIRVYVHSKTNFVDGRCNVHFIYDNLPKRELKFNNTYHNTFLTTTKRVINMDNILECNFIYVTSDQRSLSILCSTQLHIRTKTPVVQIYVNSNEVAATRTSLDVREYDATALYFYENDDTVVIDCKKPFRESGSLKIVYYNNTGETLLETDSVAHVESVQINLTQECDSNYVDCYYEYEYAVSPYDRPYYKDIYVTRIFFKQNAVAENNITSNKWFWISCGIFITIITFIVVLYFIKNLKNKRKMRQSSNTDHVNSPNNGDNPLPHPSQWVEVESEIYNAPNHENSLQKKCNSNIKNKSLNNVSDSNYANVDYTSSNATKEPALNYADILILNNTNGEEFNKPNAAYYSRVRFAETSTNDSNYVNMCMIQDPSYVNSRFGEEDVEPTYCEVQVQAQSRM